MKRFTGRILLISVAILFSTNSFAKETIQIAVGEWAPYSSEIIKHYGYTNRIIKEAFAISDIEVEFVFLPWARGYKMARLGEVDGTALYVKTPKREKDFYYSDAVIIDKEVFFHLKSYKFDWNNIEDIKGISIGATIGYSYGGEFVKAERSKKIYVERVPTDVQNFRKLLKNRIDICIIPLEAGYGVINQEFSQEKAELFTHHPHPLAVRTAHLIFSKKVEKNKKLLALFNLGLKKLKQTGKYDKYVKESQQEMYLKRSNKANN